MAQVYTFTDSNGEVRLRAEINPAPSGSQTAADLGLVNAVDLIAGPQTFYTPGGTKLFCLALGSAGFVQMDGDNGVVDIADWPGKTYNASGFGELNWDASQTSAFNVLSGSLNVPVIITQPYKVCLSVRNAGPALVPILAWQANHVYAANALIKEAGRVLWTDGGTSGGSQPTWPASFEATVGDNGMTWTDEGLLPTVGSLHLYAQVGSIA